MADGDTAGAKQRVKQAGELWTPIRLEILDDPALEELAPMCAARSRLARILGFAGREELPR